MMVYAKSQRLQNDHKTVRARWDMSSLGMDIVQVDIHDKHLLSLPSMLAYLVVGCRWHYGIPA